MENYIASEWSPIDMLQRAWDRFLPHVVMLVVVTFAVFVLQTGIGFVFGIVEGIVGAVAQQMAESRGGDAAKLVALGVKLVLSLGRVCITVPITLITTGALARMGLSAARGEVPDISAFNLALSRFPRLLAASLVAGLLGFVGFCLCILPAFFVAIVLQFVVLIILDTDLGPIAALQYSWTLSKDHLLPLCIFALGMALIGTIVFCSTCGLGTVVLQPVALIAQALIYMHLSGRTQDFLPDPVV